MKFSAMKFLQIGLMLASVMVTFFCLFVELNKLKLLWIVFCSLVEYVCVFFNC